MKHLLIAAAAALAVGSAQAQIAVPQAVDPGQVFTLALERPAGTGAELVIRRFAEEGQGAVVAVQPLVPGAEAVPLNAPVAGGSYVVELVEGGRVRHRAGLEVVAAPVMLELPVRPDAGKPFTLRWRGGAARGDVVEIVGPEGAVRESQTLASGSAEGGAATGTLSLTAPAASGAYEVRLRDGRTGTVLSRLGFEVDATKAWFRAPNFVSPGEWIRIDWFGPDGPDFAIRLVAPDGQTTLSDHPLPAVAGAPDSLDLRAPPKAGDYRLRYVNLATGEILGDAVLLVR